jgi:hypothetical protein
VKNKNQDMIYRIAFLFFVPFLFMGCQDKSDQKSMPSLQSVDEKTKSTPSQRTRFLIDHCESKLMVELEEDVTKGKDSCVLRIRTLNRKLIKLETVNVPVDRSSITNCEEDYVVVGSSCGGPCYSRLFVFTDKRKNRRFDYGNIVSNNPNLVTYIKNEDFDKLYVHNLSNSKEMAVEIDNYQQNPLIYGHLDTIYLTKNILNINYSIEKESNKKKIVNLEKILN